MKPLAKIMTLLMLALWSLASIHCDLEQVPGLAFLACCHHEGTAPHQDNDCTQDSCATIESGHYMLEGQSASVPDPGLLTALLISLVEAPPELGSTRTFERSTSPPELSRIWQFFYRAALPPRAPSLAS